MKVYDEIMIGKDSLSSWTKSVLGRTCFVDQSADGTYFTKYLEVSTFVDNNTQYKESAKREFLGAEEADPWIAAVASIEGCTVVTQEVLEPNVRKRVPLPNVLEEFQVPYTDVFSFLRAQNALFVLGGGYRHDSIK